MFEARAELLPLVGMPPVQQFEHYLVIEEVEREPPSMSLAILTATPLRKLCAHSTIPSALLVPETAAGRRLDRRGPSSPARQDRPLPSPRYSALRPHHPGQHQRSDRIALELGPGTEDAETHPASVLCTADEDGFIGDGLREGLGRPDTSRGITYLRSSGDGTFELQATVTWEITWTGTNGGGRRTVRRHLCVDQAVTGQQIRAALDLRWLRQPHVTLSCPQFTPTAENGLWRRTDSPWVPRCRSAAPRRPGGSSPCHPASERGSPRSSPRARERSDRPADQ